MICVTVFSAVQMLTLRKTTEARIRPRTGLPTDLKPQKHERRLHKHPSTGTPLSNYRCYVTETTISPPTFSLIAELTSGQRRGVTSLNDDCVFVQVCRLKRFCSSGVISRRRGVTLCKSSMKCVIGRRLQPHLFVCLFVCFCSVTPHYTNASFLSCVVIFVIFFYFISFSCFSLYLFFCV
jgi:hypothetical protein